MQLAKLIDRVPVPVKEGLDEPTAKCNVLMQVRWQLTAALYTKHTNSFDILLLVPQLYRLITNKAYVVLQALVA